MTIGVLADFGFACLDAGSGGVLAVVAVGGLLRGGCHILEFPFDSSLRNRVAISGCVGLYRCFGLNGLVGF